ncbi:tripartite tricarboxylate transporter permease [Rhodospirillaceae bacterium SYSU D60014]|uniref:tripartite tricarboxylate transporter permease n=1 Tax=Virgifigura deserti TaxID=2268457 RepID=UPI000E66D8DB
MDLISLSDLAAAFVRLADPLVLGWIVVGVAVGAVFGASPGLTATAGVALATPLTFGLGFEASMALLLGLYCAGYFAGSIPAILVNTPGAPGNAATSVDGYAMAHSGRADLAISLSVVSSFAGGVISAAILMVFAPVLAGLALEFTSVEYFTLALFGLICVAAVSRGSLVKGMISAALGMLLGTVGIDPVGGMMRFTLGLPELQSGVSLLPALIAFFAVTEILAQAAAPATGVAVSRQQPIRLRDLVPIYVRHKWLVLKSAVIGTSTGILPGTGPTIASWISYGEAARSTRDERLGEGVPAGVIAPETANNAVTGGALVPLLTLGIPGDTVTAVLLGAFLIQGIDPGPFFMVTNGDLFALILLILVAANILILVLGLGLRRYLPAILRVPPRILLPIIGVLCATGGFAIGNASFDVTLVAVLGLAGFILTCFGFPMPPLVIGLVLGPIVEVNLRNALIANQMDPTVFLTRPISAALLLALVLLLVVAWRRSSAR